MIDNVRWNFMVKEIESGCRSSRVPVCSRDDHFQIFSEQTLRNIIDEDEELLKALAVKFGDDPRISDAVHDLKDEIIACRRVLIKRTRRICNQDIYDYGFDAFREHYGRIEITHIIHGIRL